MGLFPFLKSSSPPENLPPEKLHEQETPSVVPRHVAVIMDGNGRWARQRMLPHIEGHRAGARTVRMLVEESRKLGIRYVTVYAFSSENWGRPSEEVSGLMRLFEQYLRSEVAELIANGIRLRVMGETQKMPPRVQEMIKEAEESSRECTGLELILAVSYGGRDELVRAAKLIAERVQAGSLSPHDISSATLAESLYLPDVPDPDLLIRTSDEYRISNFLLWQVAYSEIIVSPVFWPDFTKEEYFRCLGIFAGRERRFGLTSAQLAARGA